MVKNRAKCDLWCWTQKSKRNCPKVSVFSRMMNPLKTIQNKNKNKRILCGAKRTSQIRVCRKLKTTWSTVVCNNFLFVIIIFRSQNHCVSWTIFVRRTYFREILPLNWCMCSFGNMINWFLWYFIWITPHALLNFPFNFIQKEKCRFPVFSFFFRRFNASHNGIALSLNVYNPVR